MEDMDRIFMDILDHCHNLNVDYLRTLVGNIETIIEYKECEEDEEDICM